MSNHKGMDAFLPLNMAVLTVSDSRSLAEDSSGQLLADRVEQGGHQLCDRRIVRDDIYQIRAALSDWIARAPTSMPWSSPVAPGSPIVTIRRRR